MSQAKKISIITPSYNCANYIRHCIESVLSQNYENFEHIIVDGASQDGTVDILQEYPHLKWISEPDKGEAEALNKALRMVTGDIIGWLMQMTFIWEIFFIKSQMK
jgi:glycosyltransferase involved in cell wall biosynthesis